MRYVYEKREDHTCLTVRLDGERMHNYIYPMLQNNHIPGVIMPAYESDGVGNRVLVYDLSGMVTLRQAVTCGVTGEMMNCMYRGLEGLWKELDEFFISDRWCIWTPDYMYMDIRTGMPGVICVPVEHCVSMPLPREKFIQSLEAATGWRSRPVNALPRPGAAAGLREPADTAVARTDASDEENMLEAKMKAAGREARRNAQKAASEEKKKMKSAKRQEKKNRPAKGEPGKRTSYVIPKAGQS